MNSESPKPPPTTWTQVVLRSTAVSLVSLTVGLFVTMHPILLVLVMFAVSAVAGWLARRQAWLAGVIVGFPLAVTELSQAGVTPENPFSALLLEPDFWRILVPASICATGLAAMGATVGAWMQTARWQDK